MWGVCGLCVMVVGCSPLCVGWLLAVGGCVLVMVVGVCCVLCVGCAVCGLLWVECCWLPFGWWL